MRSITTATLTAKHGNIEQIEQDLRAEMVHDLCGIAAICAVSVGMSALILANLAKRVVVPIRLLIQFADSIRFGDFRRRIEASSDDELGQLAGGLNRMAEALSELQRFNIAQVLETKWTLEATLEALPDAVFLFDADERVISMNRTARQVFSISPKPSEVSLSDLKLPATSEHLVREALNGMPPAIPRADLREAMDANVDGMQIKLLPWAVSIPHMQEQSHGAVLALYDVTGFAKLDELRMEMIAVASHELKNPLTTLRMNVLMLQESSNDLSDRQRSMLGNAINGCEELAATIDEFLDLARADAGQLQLVRERLDLSRLAEHVVRLMQQRFSDANILLETISDSSPAICNGDSKRLTMVLSNLLANSLKYTPTGGKVAVVVSSMQNAGVRYGPTLRIAVTDSGPGVSAEYRDKIFEKFFRVEHHRLSETQAPQIQVRGTGVGLYLCKQIIEAHGGNIWCEDGDGGHGTRIAITLPGEPQSAQ